jgi:hypothetical protein
MRTHSTDAPIASPECSPAKEETPLHEFSKPLGEGLGVFRALMLMLIFYVVLGGILWYASHAWRHWRAH